MRGGGADSTRTTARDRGPFEHPHDDLRQGGDTIVAVGPSARLAIAAATAGGRAMTSRKDAWFFEQSNRATSAASTPCLARDPWQHGAVVAELGELAARRLGKSPRGS